MLSFPVNHHNYNTAILNRMSIFTFAHILLCTKRTTHMNSVYYKADEIKRGQ